MNKLLEHYLKQGWKPWGLEGVFNIDYGSGKIYCSINGESPKIYSVHDLFSPESGITEYIKWYNHNEDTFIWYSDRDNDCSDPIYRGWEWQHHFMKMATMNSGEKIEYFIENAIISHNLKSMKLETYLKKGIEIIQSNIGNYNFNDSREKILVVNIVCVVDGNLYHEGDIYARLHFYIHGDINELEFIKNMLEEYAEESNIEELIKLHIEYSKKFISTHNYEGERNLFLKAIDLYYK